MAFIPLFCQSHHSPLGVAAAADLARRARSLGYNTLGLCDEATIAGFPAFDAACRAQGIRPVFGCRLPVNGLGLTGRVFPIDFVIETEQGYRNLVRLLTLHHARGEGERRPLAEEDLRERTSGLTAVVPSDGELHALVDGRDRTAAERFLEASVRLFAPGLVFGLDTPTDENAGAMRKIMELARFVRAPAMAAPLVRYPEPGDEAAAIFLRTPHQAPGRSYTPPAESKTMPALWTETEALAQWTGVFEEAPHVTGELARRCTWRPSRIRRAFPTLDLERGFDPNSYLFDLVIRGATQLYGEITEERKQRINREFEELRAQNLAPYLLLCAQIAKALDEKGISRGVGRGRLVASVLAYSLGISRIDPLQYSLAPKSLLAEGETTPPIQIEIPRGGVPVLLDWLRESFGEGRLAEIGRIQETRRDQMIQELAAWADMTAEERKLAQREKTRLRSTGAAQRLSDLAERKRSRRWRDPAFIGDLAARLSPRPRAWQGTGDHYALSGEPLEAVVPLVRSTQDRPVTGLEESAIDRLGLARISLAPHGLLDILDRAVEAARAQHPGLDFANIPLDDRATYDLLGRGETTGIAPLEGITMRCLLRRHAPRNLLQLVRVKTETGGGRSATAGLDMASELPDMLLSYQCAFLKANFPLAYFGAAISAVVGGRENPAAVVRAARRDRHAIMAPDINLSDWETTIQSGSIRLGLAAVKGFGARAWEHIRNVRSGGPFETLESFCERVDTRLINLRTLRHLIAAGAMDRLGRNRATMDAAIAQLQKRSREMEEIHGGPGQATLFDLDEWEEGEAPAALPAAPDLEEWNEWDRLQREAEALGFYLSMDPVRRFRIALSYLKPLHIEDLSQRLVGKRVRIAGLVTAVETEGPLLLKKEADPKAEKSGDVIVDLEGLPVLLSARLAESSADALEPATETLVIGRIEKEGGAMRLAAEGIWKLADLEDQATKVTKIRLKLAGENKATLKLLLALADEFPGSTELELADYPLGRGFTWRRLSRRRVFFCSPLFQGLCKILQAASVELFGGDGLPMTINAAPAPEPDLVDDPEAEEPLAAAESAPEEASLDPDLLNAEAETSEPAPDDTPSAAS